MKTLVVGLAHFVDKYGYQARIFSEHGCSIRFLSTDVSNNTKAKAKEYNADVIVSGQSASDRIIKYIFQLINYKPDWLELYDVGRLTIFYFMLAKLFGVKVQTYIIGYELKISHQSGRYSRLSWLIKQSMLKVVLKYSDIVCVKEIHSREIARNYVTGDRLLCLHNCVPMPVIEEVKKCYDFSFINAVERVRHVISFIKAIELVYTNHPDIKVLIAGFTILDENSHTRDVEYEKAVIEYINSSPAKECFDIKGFITNSAFYLDRTRYFVFPSDVTFANYTLLEAMSRGVVPIVFNGEGCQKIVQPDTTGIVCYDLIKMNETLSYALDMPIEEYSIISKRAVSLIEKDFSMNKWFNAIHEKRNKNIN